MVDFAVLVDYSVKVKEISTSTLLENLKSDGDTNCNWCTRNNSQRIGKETGRLRNKTTSGDHPDNSIIKNGQTTEKNPGNLSRLAVTQISEKNYQAILV